MVQRPGDCVVQGKTGGVNAATHMQVAEEMNLTKPEKADVALAMTMPAEKAIQRVMFWTQDWGDTKRIAFRLSLPPSLPSSLLPCPGAHPLWRTREHAHEAAYRTILAAVCRLHSLRPCRPARLGLSCLWPPASSLRLPAIMVYRLEGIEGKANP